MTLKFNVASKVDYYFEQIQNGGELNTGDIGQIILKRPKIDKDLFFDIAKMIVNADLKKEQISDAYVCFLNQLDFKKIQNIIIDTYNSHTKVLTGIIKHTPLLPHGTSNMCSVTTYGICFLFYEKED